MRFTDSNTRLDLQFNPFADDYVGEILEAVAVAWSQIKQPKQSDYENTITNRLAGRLLNDPAFRDLPYDVVPQHQLTELSGRILGLLDLHFKHRQSQRDYFAFEAKRLHVTRPGGSFSNEHSIYVGNEGMMAFIDGQYSKGLPAGGMLGYVMDGDTKKAWDGLEARIENRRGELKLTPASKFAKSPLSHIEAKGMQNTLLGETMHQLDSNLRLFHLLLPVTASN